MRGQSITIRKRRNGLEHITLSKPQPPSMSWWQCDPSRFYSEAKTQAIRMQPKQSDAYITAKDSNGQHREV